MDDKCRIKSYLGFMWYIYYKSTNRTREHTVNTLLLRLLNTFVSCKQYFVKETQRY